jgi:hypothetical protein
MWLNKLSLYLSEKSWCPDLLKKAVTGSRRIRLSLSPSGNWLISTAE